MSMMLPPEIISQVLSFTSKDTITGPVSQVPQLKQLVTMNITDSSCKSGTSVTVQEIAKGELRLDPLFRPYQFFNVFISHYGNDKVQLTVHRVIARLIKLQKHVNIVYVPGEIDMTYLKMFKSLFHDKNGDQYSVMFPNLKEVKTNGNHMLISDIAQYPALTTLSLYYCSARFYQEVLGFLDLTKHPHTLQSLRKLKLEDYMNEEEDAYSMHSNNYVRYDEDYDDYDYNSDLDENEFYFDGLEIVQNLALTSLESLALKNCNMSKFKGNEAPMLQSLKIVEVSNKHIEAFDLNLVDSEHITTRSFLHSSISTSFSITSNNMPQLKILKVVGHIHLKGFSDNVLRVRDVILKGCNVELDTVESFLHNYRDSNTIM